MVAVGADALGSRVGFEIERASEISLESIKSRAKKIAVKLGRCGGDGGGDGYV